MTRIGGRAAREETWPTYSKERQASTDGFSRTLQVAIVATSLIMRNSAFISVCRGQPPGQLQGLKISHTVYWEFLTSTCHSYMAKVENEHSSAYKSRSLRTRRITRFSPGLIQ